MVTYLEIAADDISLCVNLVFSHFFKWGFLSCLLLFIHFNKTGMVLLSLGKFTRYKTFNLHVHVLIVSKNVNEKKKNIHDEFQPMYLK